MSLVVAIKTDHGIVMGCDSQVSYGNNKYSLSGNSSCKIWNIINCPFGLMGSVGVLRDSQLIASHAVIDPNRIITDSIDFDYVVCELYSTICDILSSYHRISLEPVYDEHGVFIPPILNNEFIFAYKDTAYQISQEGSIRDINDFLVIGSGAEIATGVLDNNKDKDPEERIIEAIYTCNANTLYIDNNITLFYTYDKDCEHMDCEECERKKYCGYYMNEMYDEELEEDGESEEKHEEKPLIKELKDQTIKEKANKKAKKVEEVQEKVETHDTKRFSNRKKISSII